jgi:hypothetical protein
MDYALKAFTRTEARFRQQINQGNGSRFVYGPEELVDDFRSSAALVSEGMTEAGKRKAVMVRNEFWWSAVGGMALAASLLFLFSRFRGNSGETGTVSDESSHFFPPVRVAYRFGGSFGGGIMAESSSPSES